MNQISTSVLALAIAMTSAQQAALSPKGVAISGELRQWHKVTLTLDGPQADESATDPNPFRDYRMTVSFRHESGVPAYDVPGYFAGDGNAANTSATAGNKWRAHLSPDKQAGGTGASRSCLAKRWRRLPRKAGRSRRSMDSADPSRSPAATRPRRTFEPRDDWSMSELIIFDSRAAANIFSSSEPTPLKPCSPMPTSTARTR